MASRRSIRIALVAYRDDGNVLQLVPLGTVAKPFPITALLAQVRNRIAGATVGQVLRLDASKNGQARGRRRMIAALAGRT
jgi:hypothetical protein